MISVTPAIHRCELGEADLNQMRTIEIVEHNIRHAIRGSALVASSAEVQVLLTLLDEAQAERNEARAKVARVENHRDSYLGSDIVHYECLDGACNVCIADGITHALNGPLS